MPDKSLLNQLKDLVGQIDDNSPCPAPCCPAPCCPAPCCPPACCPPMPYAQVCMTCPPPIPLPTYPTPVKPLQLPCPCPPQTNKRYTEEENLKTRYSNFYNNYNVDWHGDDGGSSAGRKCDPLKQKGQVVDGKNPYCQDYTKKRSPPCEDQGCPTGFKPCSMKLQPPPCCDPNGIWNATIQPCPPKPRKPVSNHYVPGPCTRPCCKHWKNKEGPCLYDKPCRAHCLNHPPGIKPSSKSC